MRRLKRGSIGILHEVALFPVIGPHLPNQIGPRDHRNIEAQPQSPGVEDVDAVWAPICVVVSALETASPQSVSRLEVVAYAD
jgi:hypothetical protein